MNVNNFVIIVSERLLTFLHC